MDLSITPELSGVILYLLMRQLLILYILLTVFFLNGHGCNYFVADSPPSPCFILEKASKVLGEMKASQELTFILKRKNIFKSDTTRLEGKIFLEMNNDKTRFNNFFLQIFNNKNFLKVDTLIYELNEQNKTYSKLDRVSDVANINCFNNVINFSGLNEYCKDSMAKINLSQIVNVGINKYYNIEIVNESKKEIQSKINILINTDSYLIYSVSYVFGFMNDTQFEEVVFVNQNLNTGSDKLESKRKRIESEYNLVMPVINSIQEKRLDSLSYAPAFILKSSVDSVFNLKEINNQNVIIIDFGYISCYPCLKAGPVLTDLHHRYSMKGVFVISINPYDTKDKINLHIQKYNIPFPVLLSDKNLASQYRVNSYPTIFILNSEKQILKVIEGFSDNLKQEITKLIEEEISK
ncbi:MAG: TlpA family protein disulfide reductase [Bacteroidota bacterium]|nr:TlpA family protein disulfide reductase [Bacteroidota bacterium]